VLKKADRRAAVQPVAGLVSGSFFWPIPRGYVAVSAMVPQRPDAKGEEADSNHEAKHK
jgi:hypothetical protein